MTITILEARARINETIRDKLNGIAPATETRRGLGDYATYDVTLPATMGTGAVIGGTVGAIPAMGALVGSVPLAAAVVLSVPLGGITGAVGGATIYGVAHRIQFNTPELRKQYKRIVGPVNSEAPIPFTYNAENARARMTNQLL
jgi:hypothetical protein